MAIWLDSRNAEQDRPPADQSPATIWGGSAEAPIKYFLHSLLSLNPLIMTYTTTPEGAVLISYKTLSIAPESLAPAIERAFGSSPDCLGILVVTDLAPEYPAKRERLLRLAAAFAALPEETREKYSDAASRYSFGWSWGKEIMNGKPDTLKGSYYANPVVDEPGVDPEQKAAHPEYYGKNIWPGKDERGVEGFEEAFKDLGQFVFGVGCQVAGACQSFGEYIWLKGRQN
ncbi:hypothetical protein ACGC1H_004722 [Rhizoctonia solani]